MYITYVFLKQSFRKQHLSKPITILLTHEKTSTIRGDACNIIIHYGCRCTVRRTRSLQFCYRLCLPPPLLTPSTVQWLPNLPSPTSIHFLPNSELPFVTSINSTWHHNYQHVVHVCTRTVASRTHTNTLIHTLRMICLKLFMPQVRIQRLSVGEQLAMSATLGHATLVQHQDLVGVLDRRQAVRDDDRRALLRRLLQRLHDFLSTNTHRTRHMRTCVLSM